MTQVLASIPSPPQGVWHLGPLPIRAYALFIIVGIIVALVIGDRRWVARGGQPGVVYDIALWAVPFGLIGGRLYHVMTDWRTYFGEEGAGFAAALRIWDGGLGIWGAVALGGVGAWIGCRQRGIPLPAFADAIAPGIILAQAIGRLGNYFNQELFGRPTSLPWGLKIYERRDASGALDMLNGVSTGQPAEIAPQPVHPTFLYELIWNVLVFLLLIYVDRRFKMGHGRLFAMYVAAYCVGRFGVELLRDDTATLIAGIRINLFTSTFVFTGAMVYIILAPKGREAPAALAGKPHEVEEPAEGEAEEKIAAGSEDSALVEWTRELAAVASTSGLVAGVAVAVEDEDEAEEAEEAEEAAATSTDEGQDAQTAVLEKVGAPDEEGDAEPSETEPHTEAAPEEGVAETPTEEEPAEAADVEEPAPEAEAPVAEAPVAAAVAETAARPASRTWLRRLISRKARQEGAEHGPGEPVLVPAASVIEEPEAEALHPDIQIEAVDAETTEPEVPAGQVEISPEIEPEAAKEDEPEAEAAVQEAEPEEPATEPQTEEQEAEEPGEVEPAEAASEAEVGEEAEPEEPGEVESEEAAAEAELGEEAEPEEPATEPESEDEAEEPGEVEPEEAAAEAEVGEEAEPEEPATEPESEDEPEEPGEAESEVGEAAGPEESVTAPETEPSLDDELGEVLEAATSEDLPEDIGEPGEVVDAAALAHEPATETKDDEETPDQGAGSEETSPDADTTGDESAESEAHSPPPEGPRKRRWGLPRRLREFRQAWAEVPAWQKDPKEPSD